MKHAVLLLSLVVFATGCAAPVTGAPHSDLPDTGKAFGGVQCSAVRPQTEPDLMAWDPGSRLNLKLLSRQGVVAVRYEVNGCDVRLEVLSNCIGEGGYEYDAYAANQTKVAHNAQELYTELPLGAASLSGKLKNGRALRTDYMLVGARALKAGSTYSRGLLKGPDCSKATHVVNRLYVGGFAMVAGASQSIESAVSVFRAGAGGQATSSVESLSNEGVAEACAEAQSSGKESDQCGVPLRLGLQPLDAIAVSCPEGSEAVGSECVRKRVVNKVECPAGSRWDGAACVGTATRLVSSTPAPTAPSSPAQTAAPKQQASAPAASSSSDSRARALVDEAINKYYLNVEFDRAAAKLNEARALCSASSCSKAVRLQVLGYLGIVLWGLGRKSEAETRWREALETDVTAQLSADLASPEHTNAFERIRASLKK